MQVECSNEHCHYTDDRRFFWKCRACRKWYCLRCWGDTRRPNATPYCDGCRRAAGQGEVAVV